MPTALPSSAPMPQKLHPCTPVYCLYSQSGRWRAIRTALNILLDMLIPPFRPMPTALPSSAPITAQLNSSAPVYCTKFLFPAGLPCTFSSRRIYLNSAPMSTVLAAPATIEWHFPLAPRSTASIPRKSGQVVERPSNAATASTRLSWLGRR
jgi:hypothetical protein